MADWRPGRRRVPLVEVGILIALAVALFVMLAQHLLPFWRSAENAVGDTRVASLTPPSAAPRIVLVTITEETLASLPYRSPVDRQFLAHVVEALDRAGASAIGLDVLIDRPSEPAKDAALAAALRGLKAPAVLAWAGPGHGLEPAQASFLDSFVEAAGARKGLSVLETDEDGVIRRFAAWRSEAVRPFAVVIAEAAGAPVPEAPGRIAYRRAASDGADTFPMVPAEAVLRLAATQPELVAALVRGKIALVGADLPHDDRHRAPVEPEGEAVGLAGVAVHAHGIDHILEGRRIREGAWWSDALLALLAAAWGAEVALGTLRAWARAALLAAGLACLWLGGFALFLASGLLLPLVTPTVALGLGYGSASAYAYRRESRARAFIRGAFARFVAPSVVDALTKDPARLVLGGERRTLTFLVTDVAGFTRHVERMAPADLVTLMNAYFDGVSRVVMDHGGTIAKFVGDGVFAFFGAPLDQPDHAARALAAALALDRFAEGFRRAHDGFGATRIGVNTGVAVVGNFGGKDRFDYTAMGDAANTAARLESANKHTGTRIAVSGTTAAASPGVAVRPVGELVLKGKSEAVAVFEPVGDGMASDDCERYRAAYDLMAAGDGRAAEAFEALAPADPLARFHLARLRRGERGVRIEMESK